jgi:hypothetical protein
MRICEIDIPSELLAAQQDGKLIIFAGAGVSMGPPANYPDFRGLVRKIGRGTKVKRESPDEPNERYLGRLDSKGVAVHKLTQQYLTDPKSKPNPLHTALVRLFVDNKRPRIVTTNFDSHFNTEIRRHNIPEGNIFKAPVLPVGSRFDGVVYLHGSVDDSADRLVLTDRDFGRAYLTEGWARRFLQELYATYTVLFVGYSHKDTVMIYLTRGLTPGNTRLFALSPSGDVDHWKYLGVTPIPYPLRLTGNKHGALSDSVTAWAERISMGAFDHEERVRRMTSGAPPLRESEDDDYLQDVVQDPQKVALFGKYATGKEWLIWAEERGLLSPLFSRRTVQDERLHTLAWWFSRQGVLKAPEVALGIFQRQGQVMSNVLWQEVARGFHAGHEQKATSLMKWLPILLDQATVEESGDMLEYLFDKTAKTGCWTLPLLLVDHLTRPRIRLEESYAYLSADNADASPTRTRIDILGSNYWMKEAWNKTLKPNLTVLARGILDITAKNIRGAFDLGTCHGISKPEWDLLSFHRSAIEPHEQDHLGNAFDPVIDACRDSLEWLMAHHVATARAVVTEWLSTPVPLLRRIAVHCLRIDSGISADRKIRKVVASNLLANINLHHELYLLLSDVYPAASSGERKAFLDHASKLERANERGAKAEDKDIYSRSLFRLLLWLDTAAGGCTLVKTRLQRLRKKHPSFMVGDHPDFTHWCGGSSIYAPKSPVSIEEMLAKPIDELVSLLAGYKKKSFLDENRDGLLSALTDAVKKSPEWGVTLAKALANNSAPVQDAIEHLLWGWRDAELSESQWRTVLQTLDKSPVLLSVDRDAATFLKNGVNREKNRIPESLMPLAEKVGCRICQIADKHHNKADEDTADWLHESINASGGQIAQFFMTAISIRKKQAGSEWKGLPTTLKKQLERIVESRSYTGEMGRIILASQLHFLFSCDPNWTRLRVMPLLALGRNKRQAIQGWHGYANWGRWYDELLPDLLPLYEACFPLLDTDLSSIRKPFAAQIASICLFSSRKQTRGRWLSKFLQSATSLDRVDFAEAIRRALWDLSPERAAKIWHEWLNKYWKYRLTGKPIPLDQNEADKMTEWAPHLGTAFPEAVQRIEETKLPVKANQFIYHLLNIKGIHSAHPLATAQLIKILVKTSYEPSADHGDLPTIIIEIAKDPSTHAILTTVLEHMASKGSAKVAELKALLSAANCH